MCVVLYLSFVLVQKTSCLQLRVAAYSSLSSPTFERVLPECQRDFGAAAILFHFYPRFCFWRYFQPALSSFQFVSGSIMACHFNQRRDKAAILYQQWLGYLNASIMQRDMRLESLRSQQNIMIDGNSKLQNVMSVTCLEKQKRKSELEFVSDCLKDIFNFYFYYRMSYFSYAEKNF